MNGERDMKRVFIAAGGTAGHVITAISFVSSVLKKYPNTEIHFFIDGKGNARFSRQILQCVGDESKIHVINAVGYKKGFMGKLEFFRSFILGFAHSLFITLLKRPKVVVGFGGYASAPVIMAGKVLFCRAIIHEQNVIMGRANKFLAKFANKICLSVPLKEKEPDLRLKDKTVLTGLPLRNEFLLTKLSLNVNKKKKDIENHDKIISKTNSDKQDSLKIFVMGGTLNAPFLNTWLPSVLSKNPPLKKLNLKIAHHVWRYEVANVIAAYEDAGIKADIYSFIDDPWNKMKEADLIICRAGAATIYEIAFLQKPAVVVPMVHSADNHQFYNAQYFAQHNIFKIIEEKDLQRDEKLISLLSNKPQIKKMQEAYTDFSKLVHDGSGGMIDVINHL